MHGLSEPTRLQLYESLCDSLQDSVFLLDDEGAVFYANQRFCEATGRSPDELVGQHYTDLGSFIRDDSFSEFRAHVDAVVNGTETERRVRIAARSPLEGDVVVEARITWFESPEVDGAAVVLRDFTELVELSESLARKSEQLAVVNSVLRHDIRNDMNIVLGWADLLEGEVRGDEEREMLDRIQRHGSHVVELTFAARSLVDAIEEGWEMDLRPVDVRPTVEREVDLVREQFPDAELRLPDALPHVTVQANEFLGSVVSNLLTNAVRHNDAETPRVELDVEATDETVRLSIADNGPGIPDALKEDVYEMGTAGSDSPGTGLGLYLVKSLVDAYGGTVELTDNDPRGTIVTVELERSG